MNSDRTRLLLFPFSLARSTSRSPICCCATLFLACFLACSAVPGALAQTVSPQAAPVQVSAASAAVAESIRKAAVELNVDDRGPGTGFEPLAKAIGDARIVMIGEQWHGDGGAIRLRADLVQFLHERMGFDALVFEDDFYSIDRGAAAAMAAGTISSFAADNLFPMWSQSRAAAPLWSYITAQARTSHPIAISGVDPRHTGVFARTHLVPELRMWLRGVPTLSAEDGAAFIAIVQQFLSHEYAYKPSEAEKIGFFDVVDRLAAHLSAQADPDAFALQELRNLRGAAQLVWSGASRERLMAENFAWVANNRFPNARIIVWAHNNHLITDHWMYYGAPDAGISASVAKRSPASKGLATYMGEGIRRYFGAQVFSIATLAYSGTYSEQIQTTLIDGPVDFNVISLLSAAPAGSLEAALAGAGHDFAFADLRPFRAETVGVVSRALDYHSAPPFTMRLWEGYDAVLFMKQTFGLNQDPPPAWRALKT